MRSHNTHIRYSISLMVCLTLLLASCWGGGGGDPAAPVAPATYSVGGTLAGLTAGNSITLANNGTDNLTLTADGSFIFPTKLNDGSAYNLSIATLPANQPCTHTYGAGTIAAANVTALKVICGPLPTGVWIATGNLVMASYYRTDTLLPNGKVLVAGGDVAVGRTASAELYDPASGLWSATDSLDTPRSGHTATLLPTGKVLVAGGFDLAGGALASAELYDPDTGAWSATGSLTTVRSGHTATLLLNGKLLAASGLGGLTSAELYW